MLMEQTLDKMNAMKLTGMAEALRQQLGSAPHTKLSFDERFGLLVDAEWLAREQKRLKNRIADLEKQIGEKEQAVKDVEHLMASPGFYDDRQKAEEAVSARQALLQDVASLMSEWETLQASFANA